jgi:C1A family cysteine protease
MAFAASDAHAAHRPMPFDTLSVEYAYYHASLKRATFNPHSGVAMSDILKAIEDDGQPVEAGWPYLHQLPADMTKYKPPAPVGPVYKRESQIRSDIDAIRSVLKANRPALIAMNISVEFFSVKADQVLRAPASSPSANRHALVVVGVGEEQSEEVFLVRNSWGRGWADDGHAWVADSYIVPRLISVGVMNI